MRIGKYYVGAMIGGTAYEVQIGKFYLRILRPKMYFWPYRLYPRTKLKFPQVISISWLNRGG